MTLPNFLIIGDIKPGSTSLYYYLHQHPDVFMPTGMKELRYFSYDSGNSYQRTAKSTRVRSLVEYESWFRDCGTASAVGEASPNYLRSPVAAGNIKRELQNPKLIVSLRNPVDRLYSMYLMDVRSGSKDKSFEATAFSEDCTWIKGNFVAHDLRKFYELFPRERIKVILFDDLVSSAEAVTRELYQFLSVDDNFVPELSIKNFGGIRNSAATFSFLTHLKNTLKRAGVSNPRLRKLWATIRDGSLYKLPLDPNTRAKVLEVFRDDTLRTQELIDADLSRWLD